MSTVNAPNPSDLDLRSLLDQVDARMEVLQMIQQSVDLNQKSIQIMAQRQDLQAHLLEKMLGELQGLVRGLHALAAPRDPGGPVQ